MIKQKNLNLLLVLSIVAVAVASVALQVGSFDPTSLASMSSKDANAVLETILWKIRLPRILLAFVVGVSLALSGRVCQSVLQNPLADPYLLGISSGATCGAVFAIGYLHAGTAFTTFLAFAGGLLGLFVTLLTCGSRRWFDPPSLVLGGAVASFFLSGFAILGLILANAPDLPGILFWLAGDLSLAQMNNVFVVLISFLPLFVVALFFGRDLNLLETGKDEATSLGVRTKMLTFLALGSATIATATAVAHVGMIGFIGLMVPHISRAMFGIAHLSNTLGSMLMGGTLLLVADVLTRSLPTTSELPVGIVTALIGCPFLIALIRRGYRL